MPLKKRKLQVLTILWDNLQETHPQLVPSSTIAGHMNMSLPEMQKVLKSMEGMGVIETDPDLRYNLITQKGLLWLNKQSPSRLEILS